MHHTIRVALVLFIVGTSVAVAQRRPAATATARSADLSIGYNYVGSNVPPGGADYFGLQGGYISGSVGLRDWLSVAGKFSGENADKISNLGQGLTLMTFMGGPRVSLLPGRRIAPYAEVLFGGAHGSNSYFPSGGSSTTPATSFARSATSFALSAGGGIDVNLTDRFAVRAMDVQYLRTTFQNGVNNEENQLMIGAGIVIRFGAGVGNGPSLPPPPPATQISFTCSSNVASIEQGKILEISGVSLTQPGRASVNYAWTSSGGSIDGSGRRVSLNTGGLQPGNYHITGHASLASDPSTSAECEVMFRVLAAEAPPAPPANNDANADKIFHENVQDALFDYDSYQIRTDAQVAINHAAQFLKAHPTIGVLIEGYADERGSAEYNLALAEKRANSARNALMQAGIAEDRLQIISYGKEAQVCTEQTEACFQQNRRAAFNMRH